MLINTKILSDVLEVCGIEPSLGIAFAGLEGVMRHMLPFDMGVRYVTQ